MNERLKNKMKIAVIAVNYNGSDVTDIFVESLVQAQLDCPQLELSIIIVDNASDQSDFDALYKLESRFPVVKVLKLEKNVGYFGGLNVGLDSIEDKSVFDSVIIGNNDLIFDADFFKGLAVDGNVLRSEMIISPRIKTLEGEDQNPHVVQSISKLRENVYDLYYSNFYLSRVILILARLTRFFTDRGDEKQGCENSQHIYQGYGACYLLTPLYFKEFDRLPADVFLSYEEFFLTKQIQSVGFRPFYKHDIGVVHMVHSTTGQMPSKKKWELSRLAHFEYRKHVETLFSKWLLK